MGHKFYDLSKEERTKLVREMEQEIKEDLAVGNSGNIRRYAADDDIYIRKNAYLIPGRIYRDHQESRARISNLLEDLFKSDDEKVRQTAVYVADDMGRTRDRRGTETDDVTRILEIALVDEHHSVRNAMIGALKRMGEKNPEPTLYFARTFLHHHDPMIRRAVVHGIELARENVPRRDTATSNGSAERSRQKSKKNGDPRAGADKLQKKVVWKRLFLL